MPRMRPKSLWQGILPGVPSDVFDGVVCRAAAFRFAAAASGENRLADPTTQIRKRGCDEFGVSREFYG
jgi:hypothetical protein